MIRIFPSLAAVLSLSAWQAPSILAGAQAKVAFVRGALAWENSLSGFLAAAEALGLKYALSGNDHADCSGPVDGVWLNASGSFVDGRKAGDYWVGFSGIY